MKRLLRSLVFALRRAVSSRRLSRFARYRRSKSYLSNREEIHRLAVQPGMELEVFWKETRGIGRGPACSVVVEGEEIMRLDCYGSPMGHLHADFFTFESGTEDRLFFAEETVPAQIDRAIFEVKRNLAFYTSRSPWPAARAFKPDQNLLEAALVEVRELMLQLHAKAADAQVPRGN